jgi:hypothetical protein
MKKLAILATVLLAVLVVSAGQANAGNLLQNGSFQDNNFTGWTIGTTSNGTWGSGYPTVTAWPLGGGLNAAKGSVGEVNFDGTFQGGTLSQTFTTSGGMLSMGFDWAAMGDGTHNNADGGEFVLLLDGVQLASFDSGPIGMNQTLNGMLSATDNVSAGNHTFEIEILRPFVGYQGGETVPYQYVTDAFVNGSGGGTTPEPGTLLLLGSGIAGVWLRRKRS